MGPTLYIKRREWDLEVTAGVEVKKLAPKNRGSPYLRSRGSELKAITVRDALNIAARTWALVYGVDTKSGQHTECARTRGSLNGRHKQPSAPTDQTGWSDRSDWFFRENCEDQKPRAREGPVRDRVVLRSADHSERPWMLWRRKKNNRWCWQS